MLVPVDKLEPGMEVAADVMNMNDMLLLPKGAILASRQIRLLKTWGVESVNIVSTASDEGEAAPEVIPSPESLQRAETQVTHRFRLVTAKTLTVELVKELAIKRLAQRLEQQAQNTAKDKRS